MLRLSKRPHNGRAKDGEFWMSVGMSRSVVGVEPVAGGRVACTQSVAVAGAPGGHLVCQWPAHSDYLAPGSRSQRQLPGLLLLSGAGGTQEQIHRHAIGGVGAPHVVAARSFVAGDRRFAHQAVRADGGRCGRASQSHSRTGRSAVPLRPCLGNDLARFEASSMGCLGTAAAGHALCPQTDHGDDPQVAPLVSIRHQTATGRSVGGVDRFDPENSGKNGLDRHRRGLHQTALLEAGFEASERRDRRPLAQRCGAPRPAAEKEKGATPSSRSTSQVRQEQDQLGQTSRSETWLANGRVHLVQRDSHEDLQDVPGHVRTGRGRHSRSPREGRSWLVRFLLHASRR